jgi:putative oxidoreductase
VTFAEGILKWSGFLQLNDTAILLVGDEFKLRLPDGPYSFPAPALIAFASGSVEVLAPVFLVLGLGTRFAGLVLLVMTCIVELRTRPKITFTIDKQIYIFGDIV